MEIYTIGVYNSTEKDFFNKLISNNVTLFVDVRQRRGVRGAKYSFVNSIRLQDRLNKLNISYQHLIQLAPTTNIRNIQKSADISNNTIKSLRENLDKDFICNYKKTVLNNFNLNNFVKINKNHKIVFFCVESNPVSCHRSIITDQLKLDFGFNVIHL